MKEIALTKNQVALVDDEDFERLNIYKWYVSQGSKTKYSYAKNSAVGSMARFIMNCPSNKLVDHKNHNTLDNQRHNLRICGKRENKQNAKLHNNSSSQYKGICWNKRQNAWTARIKLSNIFGESFSKFLGYFEDEIEAAKAYDRAAKEEFSDFALLNFKGDRYV